MCRREEQLGVRCHVVRSPPSALAFDVHDQAMAHTLIDRPAAVVRVLSGRLSFVVDGEELDLASGSWLHMAPGAPHSLVATEPTVMLLTLFGR